MSKNKISDNWYKKLKEDVDSANESFYEDLEINPLIDEYGVKYSPDRKRLLSMPKYIEEYVVKEGTELFFGGASDFLQTIIIPNSVIAIMDSTFCNCENLKNLCLGTGLKYIGATAFGDCGVKEIFVPNGCEIIEDYCFCESDALSAIWLPNSVKKLGKEILSDCDNLTHIYVPEESKERYMHLFQDLKDKIIGVEPEMWNLNEKKKTYLAYKLNHKDENTWDYMYRRNLFPGSLCSLDDEESWNPYYDEYSEEETDNFYGLTDGMEGDLW